MRNELWVANSRWANMGRYDEPAPLPMLTETPWLRMDVSLVTCVQDGPLATDTSPSHYSTNLATGARPRLPAPDRAASAGPGAGALSGGETAETGRPGRGGGDHFRPVLGPGLHGGHGADTVGCGGTLPVLWSSDQILRVIPGIRPVSWGHGREAHCVG